MNRYNKQHPLKVFECFAGYSSQMMAMERLKEYDPTFDYECVGWSEIDKYAIQAHNAVFPEDADKNYGDISKIDWEQVPNMELLTYSFPCQDISSAGNQRGFQKGSDTRSSLLWECEKAIDLKRPRYLLMENVKALVSKKFMPFFLEWCKLLESYGYHNYWKVLNSKDYGIPQNRERVFMVSILSDDAFEFPKPFPLEKRLKDVLEEHVDEKYYLAEATVNSIVQHCERKVAEGCGFKPAFKGGDEIATCISTRYGGRQTDTYLKENVQENRGGNQEESSTK